MNHRVEKSVDVILKLYQSLARRDAQIDVLFKRINEIIEIEQSLGGESALLRDCLETLADFETIDDIVEKGLK